MLRRLSDLAEWLASLLLSNFSTSKMGIKLPIRGVSFLVTYARGPDCIETERLELAKLFLELQLRLCDESVSSDILISGY
jgi:hypothetical protein